MNVTVLTTSIHNGGSTCTLMNMEMEVAMNSNKIQLSFRERN